MVIPHVAAPKLFPEEKFTDADMPVVAERNHYTSWADACRGEDKTTSHFDYAAPLTETVLLGTIAARLPGTRPPQRRKGDVQLLARLRWVDAPVMRIELDKDVSAIYYDPADSVLFTDAGEDQKIAEVTAMMRSRFPNAFGVSFRGDARAQVMEADLLAQFRPRVATYATEPFPGSLIAVAG
jgi:hypothetical protein